MEILKLPHPALLKPCKPVTVFGAELKVLLDGMWETMTKANGLGLAANQVGIPFRMFVMKGPSDEKKFFVNPVITKKSIVPANMSEGCLSAPGEFVIVPDRVIWVEVAYQDETGKEHKSVFHNIHAICVQHETEHLEGKSHLQSMSIPKLKRRELAEKWGLK